MILFKLLAYNSAGETTTIVQETVGFRAYGQYKYPDGYDEELKVSFNITNYVTWESTNTAYITVSDIPGSKGAIIIDSSNAGPFVITAKADNGTDSKIITGSVSITQ